MTTGNRYMDTISKKPQKTQHDKLIDANLDKTNPCCDKMRSQNLSICLLLFLVCCSGGLIRIILTSYKQRSVKLDIFNGNYLRKLLFQRLKSRINNYRKGKT